ncbi:hypothetical protein LTS09_017143 [Friedmanniomyces endolithicus]|nr:hypothetical protein LTS09_017143 [Friedmanniomyces endolithicus]
MSTAARDDEGEGHMVLKVPSDIVSTDSYIVSNGFMDMFDFELLERDTTYSNTNSPTRAIRSGKRAEHSTPSVFHEPMTSFDSRLLQAIAEDMGNDHSVGR